MINARDIQRTLRPDVSNVRSIPRWLVLVVGLLQVAWCRPALFAQELNASLFDRSNLVAWCIVPFDAAKRSPADRAAMLHELGIRHFAYDYRAEHIPSFEEELQQLKTHQIELTAWWFPTTLNEEAKQILSLLKKHGIHTQLWVMGGGDASLDGEQEAAFLRSEVERIRVIANAAAEIQCSVGLYNHGGWFGDPRNQVKIIQELDLPNVGIVYNLHHAHHEIDDLEAILKEIKPFLYAINLNGTKTHGDQLGAKILPIGEGDQDLRIIRQIAASGYKGRIGILNHTEEDAKARLEDNIAGLNWVVSQLLNQPSPKPVWKSFK